MAAEKGLIRPLLALVSMSHAERQQVAAGLYISLAACPCWGDPYREAKWLLWGAKGKAVQQRTSDAFELLDSRQGPLPNWYETVYRAMVFARGAAVGVPQQRKSGGRSKENIALKKDTVCAYSAHAALDPGDPMMAAVEEAFDQIVELELERGGKLLPYFEIAHETVRGDRDPGRLATMNAAGELVAKRHAFGVHIDACQEPIHEAAYQQVAMYPDPDGEAGDEYAAAFAGLNAVSSEEQMAAAASAACGNLAGYAYNKIVPATVKLAAVITKFLLEMAKLAAMLKFGSTHGKCVGAVLRIARQCKLLASDGGTARALASGYNTLQLHCVGCEKKELGWTEAGQSSSTAGWADVEGGSRWMFSREKAMLRKTWRMRHIVLREGVVETHTSNAPLPPGAEFGARPHSSTAVRPSSELFSKEELAEARHQHTLKEAERSDGADTRTLPDSSASESDGDSEEEEEVVAVVEEDGYEGDSFASLPSSRSMGSMGSMGNQLKLAPMAEEGGEEEVGEEDESKEQAADGDGGGADTPGGAAVLVEGGADEGGAAVALAGEGAGAEGEGEAPVPAAPVAAAPAAVAPGHRRGRGGSSGSMGGSTEITPAALAARVQQRRQHGRSRSNTSMGNSFSSFSRPGMTKTMKVVSDGKTEAKRRYLDVKDSMTVPKAQLYALCACCGYASPLSEDGAASAAELAQRAADGDRDDLLHAEVGAGGRVARKVRPHTLHVAQLWNKPQMHARRTAPEGESLLVTTKISFLKTETLVLVPVVPGQVQALDAAARKAKKKQVAFKEEAEAMSLPEGVAKDKEAARAQTKEAAHVAKAASADFVEDKDEQRQGCRIALVDTEQRSDGKGFVFRVTCAPNDAAFAAPSPPSSWYIRKTPRQLTLLRDALLLHFPYLEPLLAKVKAKDVPLLMQQLASRPVTFRSREMRDCIGRGRNATKWTGASDEENAAEGGGGAAPVLGDKWVVGVVGYEQKHHVDGDYLLYMVSVQRGAGTPWVVGKRYSDFVRLNKALLRAFPKTSLMPLPPTRALRDSTGRSRVRGEDIDGGYLAERMAALQK